MTLIGGLPAHPLLVHAVVVLVPLVSTGLILCALWPAARRHLLWPVVVLAAAALVLTPLTAETGEQLAGALGETPLIAAHEELGETMTLVVALLFAATALLAGAHVLRGRGGGRR
ncbi:membrane protein, partial [Rhodococcus rhodochrous]